jgi:ribosomal protein S18 acetylase RimI-like enzyme
MQTRIASDRVQVAVVAASSAGWIATCDGSVLGLYVDPQFAGRGVGSELLRAGEAAIRAEGLNTVELEASANAESFYSQRGYQVSGQRLANGALPMLKHLS